MTRTPETPDRVRPPAILRGGLAWFVLDRVPAGRPTRSDLADFLRHADTCDPVADALVAAMRRPGGRALRAQLDRALTHGLADVADPAPEVVAFVRTLEAEPPWLDRERLALASRALGRVPLRTLLVLTTAVTLPASYVSPRVNDVLLRGGDLHRRAAGRVAETVAWLVACAAPGGMDRHGDGFVATARVRVVHAFVRAGVESLDGWDVGRHGRPVNQRHQCVTMVPLLAVALGTTLLGHPQTRDERAAVVHLYRYMAHLMGVSPALQVAGTGDLVRLAGLAACAEVAPDASSRALTDAVLDAVPRLHDVDGPARRRRVAAWLWRALHDALVRATLGPGYARAVGVRAGAGSVVAALLLLPYAAWHAVHDTAVLLVPGGAAWAARRGHARRRADLAALSDRVRARPFERDDAVETVRRRDAELRSHGGRG